MGVKIPVYCVGKSKKRDLDLEMCFVLHSILYIENLLLVSS